MKKSTVKRIISSLILMVLLTGTAYPNSGDISTSQTIEMVTVISDVDNSHEPEKTEEGKNKHNIPPRRVSCSIDYNEGINLYMADAPEILTYGIYDVTGGCVAVFGDEESFIDFLFTLSGEYQLRFTTASYDLVGYIRI